MLHWNLNLTKSLGTGQMEGSLNPKPQTKTNFEGKWPKCLLYPGQTQVTSVTQFNATFVTQKCHVLKCNSLNIVAFSVNYYHF